jgi:hypothetical protein
LGLGLGLRVYSHGWTIITYLIKFVCKPRIVMVCGRLILKEFSRNF